MAAGHEHRHVHGRGADRRSLARALALIGCFMVAEVTVGVLAHSLALLSDAGHMLTDAAALTLSLWAARIAERRPRGALTYGFGRVEALSAQANGLTLLVLGGLICYGAAVRLASPPHVEGWPMLAVALAGVIVNLAATRRLASTEGQRSLNIEGAYRHVLSDLFGFLATAAAAGVILASGWRRADAVASLAIAAIMVHSAWALLRASARVFMESAPSELDPELIGRRLARQPGVVEVHDLHVWELTSGFVALSAHVIVGAGEECHELRRDLQRLLEEEFEIQHTTLQVEHHMARQPPLGIERFGTYTSGHEGDQA
jgi:cobalt-zinc-cadmium efflux system protein